MPDHKINTTVLFLIFNRPETNQQVFDEIRKAQPAKLFIAADGLRNDRPDDIKNCKKTLDISQQVDWDCKVSTRFLDENLGCKICVSSAIGWFFSNVEDGIILKEDCIPDQSVSSHSVRNFLKNLMMIFGDNIQCGRKQTHCGQTKDIYKMESVLNLKNLAGFGINIIDMIKKTKNPFQCRDRHNLAKSTIFSGRLLIIRNTSFKRL